MSTKLTENEGQRKFGCEFTLRSSQMKILERSKVGIEKSQH